MIFPKQTKWRKGYFKHKIALEELDENTNKSAKFFFNKRTINENTNKSTTFWLKVWQDWALTREYDVDIEKYPILSYANNKQVIIRCCSYN
jgi:hypothetical protein